MQNNHSDDSGAARKELSDAIANALYPNSAYQLPAICQGFGLAEGTGQEAFSGKVQYVLKRIEGFTYEELFNLAGRVVAQYPDYALQELLERMKSSVAYRISELTRRALARELDGLSDTSGHLGIQELLGRVWPLGKFKAAEYDILKGCVNFADSVYQHMVRNNDWTIVEVLEELHFYTISDWRLGQFLELLISPLARDEEGQKRYAQRLNVHLAHDAVELRHVEDQSGYPVYRLVPITGGVAGRAKNLIFAADGPKPELVLEDAVSNDVKIISNAECCLVFDDPIPNDGLRWKQLVNWWARAQGLKPQDEETDRNLYKRLAKSLASKPERTLFHAYYKRFMPMGERLPALLPQVYLHYDPYTRQQLGGAFRLKRQRMDFLMLLNHYTRIVIEVDGKQHYADQDHASPQKYAQMVSADRDLKLAGYDVYRFGGAELQGSASEELVFAFFNRLFQKHHRL